MSAAGATVLAAAIAATISLAVAILSQVFAKRIAERTAQAQVAIKIQELTQEQFSDVIRERIGRYPSLWSLCQRRISVQLLRPDDIQDGWAKILSDELEEWHAQHGLFLSEECYQGLFRLRKEVGRQAAGQPAVGRAAWSGIQRLDEIWSSQFMGFDGQKLRGLSVQLKNDLGAYQQVALSSPERRGSGGTDRG